MKYFSLFFLLLTFSLNFFGREIYGYGSLQEAGDHFSFLFRELAQHKEELTEDQAKLFYKHIREVFKDLEFDQSAIEELADRASKLDSCPMLSLESFPNLLQSIVSLPTDKRDSFVQFYNSQIAPMLISENHQSRFHKGFKLTRTLKTFAEIFERPDIDSILEYSLKASKLRESFSDVLFSHSLRAFARIAHEDREEFLETHQNVASIIMRITHPDYMLPFTIESLSHSKKMTWKDAPKVLPSLLISHFYSYRHIDDAPFYPSAIGKILNRLWSIKSDKDRKNVLFAYKILFRSYYTGEQWDAILSQLEEFKPKKQVKIALRTAEFMHENIDKEEISFWFAKASSKSFTHYMVPLKKILFGRTRDPNDPDAPKRLKLSPHYLIHLTFELDFLCKKDAQSVEYAENLCEGVQQLLQEGFEDKTHGSIYDALRDLKKPRKSEFGRKTLVRKKGQSQI